MSSLFPDGSAEYLQASEIACNEGIKLGGLTFSSAGKISSDPISAGVEELSGDLSDQQKQDLIELSSIIDNGESLDSIISSIESFEDAISAHEGADVVLSASSVARHSLQYWNDNSTQWTQLFGGSSADKALLLDWKGFAKADALGAVGGAFVGARAGAAAGAAAGGVGAIPGALAGAAGTALAAACGGSAIYALVSIFEG